MKRTSPKNQDSVKTVLTPPEKKKSRGTVFLEYILMAIASVVTAVGIYFFTFPYNFAMGGVSGLSVVLGELIPVAWMTPAVISLVINVFLIILGFLILGRDFGIRTVYCSLIVSGMTYLFQWIRPMAKGVTLTEEPFLELLFAIFLPAAGSAFLFYLKATSGGTDIVAMILKKFFRINISRALFCSDLLIVIAGAFVFDTTTFLFSLVGFFARVFLVNNVLESITTSKYCTVITTPACRDLLCRFIIDELHKTATVSDAYVGVYGKEKKVVILAALTRSQAARLRRFSDTLPEKTFTIVTSTNEILGLGFREPI